VEYESEAPTLTCVGHALACGGNVAMRRVVTSGGEAREGRGEMRRWPGKPKRNKSSLNLTGSKTPKATRTKEKATTRLLDPSPAGCAGRVCRGQVRYFLWASILHQEFKLSHGFFCNFF
jgi:hypothetical protein